MSTVRTSLCALSLVTLAAASSATTFEVKAYDNSTSGGVGVATLALTAGQQFSVSVAVDDLWSAGPLPRWSNANGLVTDVFYAPGTDSQVPVYAPGTQIGGRFGTYSQNGLTAAYGTLVGQFGTGSFFAIGTSYTGLATSTDTLKLFYFDSNNGDNSGSVLASVTAVPEPETYALLLAGLGVMGVVARRRKSPCA
jgi:hypothetical protein